MLRRLLLLALAATLTGCSSYHHIEEPPWPAPTPVVRAVSPKPSPYQGTSLWTDSTPLTGGFQDIRAREVGDLVTVIVTESSEASREASTDVSRDSGVSAGIGTFLDVDLEQNGFKPSVSATTGNSYSGSGTTRRRDVLRTQVTARVVNVLEDGNLVLEGRRQVQVNHETQYLFVRGIARPVDIAPGNTITSVALADAQILYGGKGLVSDQQKPGWMYSILDKVWPF